MRDRLQPGAGMVASDPMMLRQRTTAGSLRWRSVGNGSVERAQFMRAPLQRPAMAARGSAAGQAARMGLRSDALLRGERPSTVRSTGMVRSTETDATSKPRRGRSPFRARAPRREAREEARRKMSGADRRRSNDRLHRERRAPPHPVTSSTGMPSVRALSTRLPVMPEPGKAITPFGMRLSRSSLRLKGAALP